MKKNDVKPCLEVKRKTHEIVENGKKAFVEETYVLTRKIKRRKTANYLKAIGKKHINRSTYNGYLHEKEGSLLSKHWREYGEKV